MALFDDYYAGRSGVKVAVGNSPSLEQIYISERSIPSITLPKRPTRSSTQNANGENYPQDYTLSAAPISCDRVFISTATYTTVTSPITSYFNSGTSLDAGTYKVIYLSGAFQYDTNLWATANTNMFLYYNNGADYIQIPANLNYSTSANAVTNGDWDYTITHTGGKISLRLSDTPGVSDYDSLSGNINGDPNPTYILYRLPCGTDPIADENTLLDGLRMYYAFEGSNGLTFNSSVSSTYNIPMTATNGDIDTTTGVVGTGLSLLRSQARYIKTPNSSLVQPNTASLSVAAWFNVTSAQAIQGIINKWSTAPGNRDYSLYISDFTTTGKVAFLVSPAGSTYSQATYSIPLSSNTRYFVVGVCDLENGFLKISVNGSLFESVAYNNSTINSGSSDLIIGKDQTEIAYLGGMLDEVGIWFGKALTYNEVVTLYNSGSGKTYPFA